MNQSLGISGRIAQYFQSAQLTPLLALLAFLLGLFAMMVTPREEEPQINVTMANVMIPFPGASAKNVEQMVAIPAEQVLSQISDVDHVYSVSQAGMAIITVQFEVGVTRETALVRLYDTVHSNRDWLPSGLGVLEPVVKPKGIDDVPIVTLTLFTRDHTAGAHELARVAHSMEAEIKRVEGTREVSTIGAPTRAIYIAMDPTRMQTQGITLSDIENPLRAANAAFPHSETINVNQRIQVQAGQFLRNTEEVADLVIGVRNGQPIYLRDVATVSDGPLPAESYVWHGIKGEAEEFPALTLSITKKPGQNAIDVANAVIQRVDELHNTIVPDHVEIEVSRNYGETANEKAQKLIQKLMFATLSVVALVFLTLGRREAAIVGLAVVLTLMATLFASWAYGFTLNRVSLFALIFSIGILVDDAIVVVENIHRHQALYPHKSLKDIIPAAVDEVGGPTILATFTVIAALLPMAFVSGLMGPYMAPIPINSSMGMLLSLAIAFVVTPWLARLWMKHSAHQESMLTKKLHDGFQRFFTPFLDEQHGKRRRAGLGLIVATTIAISMALPILGAVVLKMLPFDNKSEVQIVVDMPTGSALENTAALLHDIGDYLQTVPEVKSYQAYAGSSAPINFNGLVRQYYLRRAADMGDIQVNLVDKHHRDDQSHLIASRIRPAIVAIAKAYNADVKVVEVPPGPPVLSPIVAEVYGPSDDGRLIVAKQVRAVFDQTNGIVDRDDSTLDAAPRQHIVIDQQKAAQRGIAVSQINDAIHTALSGKTVSYLHDESKYPAGLHVRLPAAHSGDVQALLNLPLRNASGGLTPLRELVTVQSGVREQTLYHKDGLPVIYVIGDKSGDNDSPLYGMFAMRAAIESITAPDGGKLNEFFITAPSDPYRSYAIKWDGEWQITYETFRDMGAAYAVGLILIYLLVVAQFGSYVTPLIIMAPIPLTIIGVMPGHALLGAQFTATSMIGMIALAGIIVRNSILLVDFIKLQVADGVAFKTAIINSAATRAQPILLTAVAAMMGAFFILDDPIFNGLAISLIFGIMVSTVLTLFVIPLLYFAVYHRRHL